MEFCILGPLLVRSNAGLVAVGGGKRRALLALLLLHANEPVSAGRLAVGLWGEDAPEGAIKTVRVHVARLRAALDDPDVLVTTPAGYRLRTRPGELDAERFERLLEQGQRELADGALAQAAATLRTALSLWRGPALADLRYEVFAQAEIARLEALRWDAIEGRNEAELGLGHGDAVLADADAQAADAPLRERLIEQRMRALCTPTPPARSRGSQYRSNTRSRPRRNTSSNACSSAGSTSNSKSTSLWASTITTRSLPQLCPTHGGDPAQAVPGMSPTGSATGRRFIHLADTALANRQILPSPGRDLSASALATSPG
jgi:DNA-binding SARP family transcriptional activator